MHILYESRNFRYSTLCELTRLVRVGRTDTRIFNSYQRYFYFQYHQHSGQLKIFQNLSLILLGLSLK